ncbi:MAG: riboflavin synthase [Candidatus Omnitrophica bacterium]|nr:riboflavin synthase [Candidatus Omnitrophota bacterium]HOX54499.1 riboflavin synthase [Candidatus Omnitrophota bacterium]
MFTGIIENLGSVEKKTFFGGMLRLTIKLAKPVNDIRLGESISVNGVCLTVTKIDKDLLTFDILEETKAKTNLDDLKIRDMVNIERALKANDRLSGHFVAGHVDNTGIIRRKELRNGSYVFHIAVSKELIPYIVPKGSIAVDGISLTIVEVKGNIFSVHIIPHTYKNTSLSQKSNSDKVNIEVDQLSKYAANLNKTPR